ncbi:g192 [Coccomyxa viridis]|uniref:G192 protein n=1 Tax=Coccomyxa viridis TaxID=1274662 RepID=A0ABP1FIS9_9CHLO
MLNTSQYVDALRLGNIQQFKEIEEASGDWWSPNMDRGAGACLHFAADHGQLHCVKFLVEQRDVEINQLDHRAGWTPLMRVAHMAHHTELPYLATFEYLLQQGADASILGQAITITGIHIPGVKVSAIDVAVEKGRGWEPGQVRRKLQGLIDKYAHIPKKPAYTYRGGVIGETPRRIQEMWDKLPVRYPPENWRAPPEAGYVAAQGMRRDSVDPWRPAGENDGSFFTRPMTEDELREQSERVAAM